MELEKDRSKLRHKIFLEMAESISKLSRDGSTKVGCVLVDSSKRIISVGYNGSVSGMYDSLIDYSGKSFVAYSKNVSEEYGQGSFETHKNNFMIHAELNALLSCDDRRRLKDASAYITHFPCNNCLLALAQSGVKELFIYGQYAKNYQNYYKESLAIIEFSGMTLEVILKDN